MSIIRRGRTVTCGTLADLRRHALTAVHAVTVADPGALTDIEGLADPQRERLDELTDSRFTIDPDHLDAAIGRLHSAGIHTLTVTPPSLGALFLQSYGETLDPKESTGDESLTAQMEASTPLRRIGEPDDIAAAVLFLASPAGGYLTGKVLEVDGGIDQPNLDMGLPDLGENK